MLTNPLALTIDGSRETLCVVIDGLDECARGEFNALAEVLARHVPRLPAWLRVLVTSREVAAVKAPLVGTFALELHGDSFQNQADIRQYFVERLEESQGSNPAWEYALDTLTERSGGIFLYAQLVCDGILAGKISICDTDFFPDGLSKAFYLWFCWFFPDDREYKANFRLPLGMLLAAPEPLPTEEFKRIFEWDNNQLMDFLRRIEVLLRQDVNDFGKETITFTHLYLNEWLGTEQAGCFRSDQVTALEYMAERFYTLFQKDVKSLTEYESLYLAPLLEQYGNTAALAEVILDHNLFWNIICAGNYCRTWGMLTAASVCYERAHAMAGLMVQKRGMPDDYKDLGLSYVRIADILKDKGDLDEALERYQKSMEINGHLVRERGTPEDHNNLSVSYNRIADILEAKGDLDEALEQYQKSMEIDEYLVGERGTPEDHRGLSVSYNRIASILQDKGDLDGALELYQKSMEIREQLVHERGTPGDYSNLSVSYNRIAGILQAKGDLDGALALYQKSMEIREQLVQERGTPGDRRNLSVSYEKVADILKAKCDLNGALKLYQKGMEIAEQLVRERDIVSDYDTLAVFYYKLAALPVLPDVKQFDYANRGLKLSGQLLKATGLDRYWNFCKNFNRLIEKDGQHNNRPIKSLVPNGNISYNLLNP